MKTTIYTDNSFWAEKLIWKKCFVSTFLCLIGCSIGSMGTIYFLMNSIWYLKLLFSVVLGLVSCIFFTTFWDVIIRKEKFLDAIRSSIKMSIVSIGIMIIAENITLWFIYKQNYTHNNHDMQHFSFGSIIAMMTAMGFGFILALPYNYYQLKIKGKICH